MYYYYWYYYYCYYYYHYYDYYYGAFSPSGPRTRRRQGGPPAAESCGPARRTSYRIGSDRIGVPYVPEGTRRRSTSVRQPKVAAFIPRFPICTAIQAGQRARGPSQMLE